MNGALLPPPVRGPGRSGWRGLWLGYVFLAVLWASSTQVPRMNALWLGVATLSMSLPAMLALWHHGAVRRLIALHQYLPGRGLHRWGSRRAIAILLRALMAIALSLSVLLQSVFFGTLEWALLGLAPLVYLFIRTVVEAKSASQFSVPVYAQRWSIWATQCLVIAILAAVWVLVALSSSEAPQKPYADRIHELQSHWAHAASGTVKWALDAAAWGQASIEMLGHLNGEAWWRSMVAAVIAPLSVFGYLALSLTGLSLSVADIRRTLGQSLTADDSPPPVGPARAAVWAAVAAIVGLLLFQMFGALDARLRAQDSPFAIAPLPECERIGGKVYRIDTSKLLESLRVEVQGNMASYQGSACAKLFEVEKLAEQGVDQYLDWYFSLGAEWSRMATLLTGDVDLLLQSKFNESVLSNADVQRLLTGVQADYEQQWSQVVAARSRALELLEANRLVVSDRDCKVVKELTVNPWTAQLADYKTRLTMGSGAGLIAGALAAKVTAKAMSKASMKSAGTVLMKASAKKGLGKVGSAAAGAAIGTVVAPGVGTAVGAVIGAGVGLALGTAIDMAALAAEEKLTRADMKKDLLSAVTESLRPYRDSFQCK